jgi:hypothetical protein
MIHVERGGARKRKRTADNRRWTQMMSYAPKAQKRLSVFIFGFNSYLRASAPPRESFFFVLLRVLCGFVV